MRRLLRTLLNAATVLSIVGCGAALALWTRSHWRADIWHDRSVDVTPDTPAGGYVLKSRVRGFSLLAGRACAYREDEQPRRAYLSAPEAARLARSHQRTYSCSNSPPPRAGDETPHFSYYHKPEGWGVLFPLWVPTAAFALLPIARLAGRLWQRPPAGHCPHCNYDLRATPTRCPECGQTVSALTPFPATPRT
jgi:hypothetical protein